MPAASVAREVASRGYSARCQLKFTPAKAGAGMTCYHTSSRLGRRAKHSGGILNMDCFGAGRSSQ